MKVMFVDAESAGPSIRQGAHTLRPDREYVVLGVECQAEGPNYFRIESKRDELPPLLDSRLFEVVDARMSPTWTARIGWDGSVSMEPSEWQRDTFWEDFTNGDAQAVEVYERCRDLLHGEA